MNASNFQNAYGAAGISAQCVRPLNGVAKLNVTSLRYEFRKSRPAGDSRNAKPGFLNQSIDEIARLYVESPFSW